MTQTESSLFSDAIYRGPDAELDAAYRRNVESGTATPSSVATAGLAAVVNDTLRQHTPEASLTGEVRSWVEQEVADGWLGRWSRYDSLMPVAAPDQMFDLKLADKYARLHDAKLALDASSETTPSGERIGSTMHLALIPWQGFRDNLSNLEQWMNNLRRAQGAASSDDYIGHNIVNQVRDGAQLYRQQGTPRLLSATEYLDQRIAADGSWGVMLVQTSDDAGLKSFMGRSPDDLTDSGRRHFELDGLAVDDMGIFEWLALTLQEDPSQLSSDDYSWLLANRFQVGGGSGVPRGDWYGSQVKSSLN